jgi:AraC-like DNA-binding protein
MSDWFSFIELITGFTTILLSLCFLVLVNYVLTWLPSKNFLVLILAIGVILKTSLFARELFNNTLSFAFFLLTFPLILLIGPVLTRFTESTLRMERQRSFDRKSMCLLAAGYLLVLPLLSLTVLAPIAESMPLLQTLATISMIAFVVLFVVSSSWNFLPILWRLSRGDLYSVGYGEPTYHWLRGIWLSISAIWLMLLFETVSEYFFGFDTVWHTAFFDILDLGVWFALLFFTVVYCRRPHEDEEIELGEASEKYEKSALTITLATQVLETLDQLMQAQRPYLESDITLDKLAALAKVQPQYLSQAINQYREINFYEYIAAYRIEFAKAELRDETDKSILDIAMSAGFNAKSTFNLTFKKIVGLTPSAYRKQQLS